MKKHLNIKIYGQVQGIFFRAQAKELADNLEIKGFAKNMPDGSVYIEAEGERDKLDKFLKWCHQGPTMAKVEDTVIEEDVIKEFTQFDVS